MALQGAVLLKLPPSSSSARLTTTKLIKVAVTNFRSLKLPWKNQPNSKDSAVKEKSSPEIKDKEKVSTTDESIQAPSKMQSLKNVMAKVPGVSSQQYVCGDAYFGNHALSFYDAEMELQDHRISRLSSQDQSHRWANRKEGQTIKGVTLSIKKREK